MNIKQKLVGIFLLIALVPLVSVALFSYYYARNTIEIDITNRLNTIADVKVYTLEELVSNRKRDVEVLMRSGTIRRVLTFLIRYSGENNNSEYIKNVELLDHHLEPYDKDKRLADIMLLDTQGKVVYVSCDDHKYQLGKEVNPNIYSYLSEFKKGIYFSEMVHNLAKGVTYGFFVCAPIKDREGKLLGILMLELNWESVYSQVLNTDGLGETGETLIAQLEDKETKKSLLFLNSLRFDPQTVFNKRVYIGAEAAIPMQNALKNTSGWGVFNDYRNKSVLAAWRYIPSLEWGLVTKMDTKEIFQPLQNLRSAIFVFCLWCILGVLLLAFIIAKTIAKPIELLQSDAQKIGSGDFEHPVTITGTGEARVLSKELDSMRIKLRDFHLIMEAKIQDKTKELKFAIDNISKQKEEAEDSKNAMLNLVEDIQIKQNQLRNAASEWRKTFDSIEDLISIHARDQTILRVNLAFASVFKKSPVEIIGHKCYELFHKKTKSPVFCELETVFATGVSTSFEAYEPLLGMHFEVTMSPIFDDKGDVNGVVHVAKDISNRKTLEEESKKHLRELEVFYKASVNREERIVELKKEIKQLRSDMDKITKKSIDRTKKK